MRLARSVFRMATRRLTFLDHRGQAVDVVAGLEENLLVVAKQHGLQLEGACECSLACSTCHVYF
jgi:ferredoxin